MKKLLAIRLGLAHLGHNFEDYGPQNQRWEVKLPPLVVVHKEVE